MTPELLNNISLVSYILSIFCFVITVIIFFRLNIRGVIGELTGVYERRAIENIRTAAQTEQSKELVPFYMKERSTGKLGKNNSKKLSGRMERQFGASGQLGKSGSLGKSGHLGKSGPLGKSGHLGKSGPLGRIGGRRTSRLSNMTADLIGQTAKLSGETVKLAETTLLVANEVGATTILSINPVETVLEKAKEVEVLTSIVLCDTDEVIE